MVCHRERRRPLFGEGIHRVSYAEDSAAAPGDRGMSPLAGTVGLSVSVWTADGIDDATVIMVACGLMGSEIRRCCCSRKLEIRQAS